MKIFITGATGYIGGSVAVDLVARGHAVSGLARSAAGAEAIARLGAKPIVGTLDDAAVLTQAAREAEIVVDTASADHRPSTETMLSVLAGSGKTYVRTSGSSIVGTRAGGTLREDTYTEDTPFTPSPGRASRVAIDATVKAAADRDVRSIVICPSLIYGLGRGPHPHSIQVPWLITVAKKYGVARHIGPGSNRWSTSTMSSRSMRWRSRRRQPARSTSPRTVKVPCAKSARRSAACWASVGAPSR
jgi:nucleoside-diphosphate-sugar epimerase